MGLSPAELAGTSPSRWWTYDAEATGSRVPPLSALRATVGAVIVLGVAAATQAGRFPAGGSAPLPWWGVALGYFAAGSLVVHVHLRRHAHTLTLDEVPLALGLTLATPSDLVVGAALGAGLALALVRRQPALKLAFNLGLNLCVTSASLALLHALRGDAAPLSERGWMSVLATALLVSGLGGAIVVGAVVRLGGDSSSVSRLAMLPVTLGACALNTLIGLGGAHLAAHDSVMLVVIAVPSIALVVAYRQYLREATERHRIADLYDSARAFSGAHDAGAVTQCLLTRACDVLNAEVAEVLLLPDDSAGRIQRVRAAATASVFRHIPVERLDDIPLVVRDGRSHLFGSGEPTADALAVLTWLGVRDAVVAPLRGETGSIGVLVVGNRMSDVATFGSDDLSMVETLAGQGALALDRARLAAELHELAYCDPLTGLGNRAFFTRGLELTGTPRRQRRQDRNRPSDSRPAIVYLDLDDFKMVNDSLGHAAGDRLLAEVGARLRHCLRPGDLAARLGGDEFAVLLDDVVSPREASAVAHRLLSALDAPVTVDGVKVAVTASAGVAVAGVGGEAEPTALLGRADVAMYRAKGRGKGAVEIFDPSMQARVLERHRLMADLRQALADRSLAVVYQPVVELPDGRMTAVEALARWRHPVRGEVPPAEFIAMAEETGDIQRLGAIVLEEACARAADWQRLRPGLRVSVNVSGRQLREPEFAITVASVLERTGLAARLLVLEVTETVMVADEAELRRSLRALRDLGVELAIDDFGTGYSSLASLGELPVGTLKIAKPFIDRLGRSPQQDAFAAAIIALGQTLGLTLVAEGIEHQDQVARLTELRCPLGQGFLFGRPVSADELQLGLAG